MNSARADVKKNRLYITLQGNVDKSEAEMVVGRIVHETGKLHPGFDVITDLTQAKIGHLNASGVFRGAMEFLSARGARRVVRVVGRSKVILAQFMRLSQGFSGYKAEYVGSMEAAEKLLAKKHEPKSAS